MEDNNLTKLFNDVPLYEDKKFEVIIKTQNGYEVVDKNFTKMFEYMGLKDNQLNTICLFCKEKCTFKYEISEDTFDLPQIQLPIIRIFFKEHRYCKNNNIPEYAFFSNRSIVINYYFECANDTSHAYYMIIYFEYENGFIHIKKIGQYPKSTLCKNYESSDYREILEKMDCYDEYKHFEESYTYGLYAGSEFYLRRSMEKIADYYVKKKGIPLESVLKFKDKVEACRDCYDQDILPVLSGVYALFSEDIHKRPEDLCKESVDKLRSFISIQLEHEASKTLREKNIRMGKYNLEALKDTHYEDK